MNKKARFADLWVEKAVWVICVFVLKVLFMIGRWC